MNYYTRVNNDRSTMVAHGSEAVAIKAAQMKYVKNDNIVQVLYGGKIIAEWIDGKRIRRFKKK